MIVGRQQAIVRPGVLQVEALHPGRDGLRDHLLLALLAEQVGDDARHALREAHALDLLVLHVAAQREAHEELLEVDRIAPPLASSRLRRRAAPLRGGEGALGVHPRELRGVTPPRLARHRGLRLHGHVHSNLARGELLDEAVHAHHGRPLRSPLPRHPPELLVERGAVRAQHGLHGRLLQNHLAHLDERVRLGTLEQHVLEQEVKKGSRMRDARMSHRTKTRQQTGFVSLHARLKYRTKNPNKQNFSKLF